MERVVFIIARVRSDHPIPALARSLESVQMGVPEGVIRAIEPNVSVAVDVTGLVDRSISESYPGHPILWLFGITHKVAVRLVFSFLRVYIQSSRRFSRADRAKVWTELRASFIEGFDEEIVLARAQAQGIIG